MLCAPPSVHPESSSASSTQKKTRKKSITPYRQSQRRIGVQLQLLLWDEAMGENRVAGEKESAIADFFLALNQQDGLHFIEAVRRLDALFSDFYSVMAMAIVPLLSEAEKEWIEWTLSGQ